MKTIIIAPQILFQNEWVKDHALLVNAGKIVKLLPKTSLAYQANCEKIHTKNAMYLVPGFIDLHIHGAMNCDVMDATTTALATISEALAKEGVTHFLATTMTSDTNHIERVLATIAQVNPAQLGILGVHLEGPFIAKAKAGAQKNEHCLLPDIALVKKWLTIYSDIKLMTLAPELPNAMQFIRDLQQLDIRVAIGHTDATFTETRTAIQAGAEHATHLFNAMRGINQREPGATGALLLADDVMTELIVDGMHLHPSIVQLTYEVKKSSRILLVTDAMRAKCMGDGCYELGGQTVQVMQGKATLMDGTLAGSTLTMTDAIKNMLRFTGCELKQALQMASLNPARALQIENHKGEIAPGKDADLVLLDAKLNVLLTLREGNIISGS